jgi:hypothetical protein
MTWQTEHKTEKFSIDLLEYSGYQYFYHPDLAPLTAQAELYS